MRLASAFTASATVVTLLAACSEPGVDPPPDPPPEVSPTAVYLTPTQHLTRASLALRGVRPAVDELRAVAADAGALPGLVDRYLATPAFRETIKELHNEVLLMRVEQPQFTFPAIAPIATATAREINDSVFDEPLELIADIVTRDRPYTEIVTADYTLANGVVAAIWGLPHTGAPDAWERTPWPDNRGAAGILATTSLFHRWRSTGDNYNRGRANVISTALLCHDYLHADILIDTTVDLSDPDVVANAVVANPSCAGCHQTLDPLASYLFVMRGQQNLGQVDSYPVEYYLPNQLNRWRTTNKRPPLFFGQPATGLAGLGAAIAGDPRFARCAAQNFAAYFTEVAGPDVSGAWIARLQAAFVASGYNARALARAIVLSDEFRVSHDTDPTAAETTVAALKLRPDQLSRMLADLTGMRWDYASTQRLRGVPYGTADLLASDFIGYRVLAGGIDSYFVTQPVHTMNATSSRVARAAAASAADFVVNHDATAPIAARTLFVAADVASTDAASVRAQLVHLHARIYGELVAADAPEIDETYSLFTGALAAAGGDARRAWKLTLVGMLSDFRSLFY